MHRVTSEQLDVSRLAWQNESDVEKQLAKVTRQGSALKEIRCCDHIVRQLSRTRSLFGPGSRSRRSQSETTSTVSRR
ncbi:unnamed protein product [Caenorhabditis angaria]|uniref:Uncharacterized protein n=1 Tax=Caenorhabditis angaria TaxID=860376 RepID=A0A9P1I6F2_9PELO|nr:unnamed protein product [Caenorhabditis angaria]